MSKRPPAKWMRKEDDQLRAAAASGEAVAAISKRLCRSERAVRHRALSLGIKLPSLRRFGSPYRLVELGLKAKGEMTGHSARGALFAVIAVALSGVAASAQSPKELKTKSGSSVVVVNFLNARPDCSASPGPMAVPVVHEKPTNGIIQMMIVVTDVAAAGKCPARKIPSTALIYTPNKDFVGTDSVQIEVEAGNRTTLLSYRITVQLGAEPL
jgi:hypothetical protein